MTAPHFLTGSVEGDPIVLTGDEAFHAARTLRVRAGEVVTVGDGRGGIVEGPVAGEPSRSEVRVHVTARRTIPRPHPRVHVFPAIPKSGKLDLVVQKLTEIGVDAIAPWFAERSVVHWDERKRRAHGRRLRAVAREAAKQSRRAWLPDVHDPGSLPALPAFTVVLHEGASTPLSDELPEDPPDVIGIVVGPEGGLSAAETTAMAARGVRIAGLGEAILRTETAAIIGAALVLHHFLLLG